MILPRGRQDFRLHGNLMIFYLNEYVMFNPGEILVNNFNLYTWTISPRISPLDRDVLCTTRISGNSYSPHAAGISGAGCTRCTRLNQWWGSEQTLGKQNARLENSRSMKPVRDGTLIDKRYLGSLYIEDRIGLFYNWVKSDRGNMFLRCGVRIAEIYSVESPTTAAFLPLIASI